MDPFQEQPISYYLHSALGRYIILISLLCLGPILMLLHTENKRQENLRANLRGCKKVGLDGPSNLSDEYSPKYSILTPPSPTGQPTSPWKIKGLFIYPIKSCAPVELSSANLFSTGLSWDRQFCFAEWTKPRQLPRGFSASEKEKERWVFRTLRQIGYEGLVKVRPEIWLPDPSSVDVFKSNPHPSGGVLAIHYPNLPHGLLPERLFLLAQRLHLLQKEFTLHVPLHPDPTEIETYPLEHLSIWSELQPALNYGRHIPSSFRSCLQIPGKTPFTLFRLCPSKPRTVVHANAPAQGPGPMQVPYQPIIAFPDSYPVHLLNLASVRDVAERVKDALPTFSARRFRANIIVAGGSGKPYDEDDWKRIRVHPKAHQDQSSSTNGGDKASPGAEPIDFLTACHTLRCRLPNVDPDTAIRHDEEPDKTLRSFRKIDQGDQTKAALGLQLVPAGPGLTEKGSVIQLRVGDEIEVLERGELVYNRGH